ncbi:hypothetical protein JRQ81_013383 [Phrynocephalus forsythii]|uniref:C-type lectin domain-containing protein n=1 Tax=Phrynocephalus forsythii TaxID=171643 RepID=A0A9Q0Y027_9SAUR|nr:hypothetical protein JRQ81_013383 [Phrynocephalus forsythii]
MNWNLLSQLVAILTIKLITSSLFLLYSSQIFQQSPTASDQHTYQHKNSCHFGWDLFEGKCYFFSGIEKTWDESGENCAKSNSHLAVINNRAELMFLMRRTRSVYYFIGLTKIGSGEEWKWIDNTMYDPDIFHMSVTDFDCAVVGMNVVSSTSCSVTNYWVCEEI